MKSDSAKFNFGKMAAPAVGVMIVVGLSTMNACSPSDRSTGSREEVIAQNAAQNATEAEAAEAQLALKTATAETKPAEKQAAAAPKQKHRVPASAAGGVYVVQVGAFKIKENAEKLQEKLRTAGYLVDMQTIDHSKNGTLHLVRFQPVHNRAEAETVVEDLSSKQDLHAQILNLPGDVH